ncbi:hypothetical protein DHD80_10220 [Gramella sp. AN32]|nr:hypothetical protein [Gramella sp. AN32]
MRFIFFISFLILAGLQLFGQSEQLARNFYDQGEYEKALNIYEKLHEKNPANPIIFNAMVSTHQQLENFDIAEKLLMERLNSSANNPTILIELGHNFEVQEKKQRAVQFYEEALKSLEGRPNYAYGIARSFEQYNLLDYAAKAYERAMEMSPDKNYNLQLAKIYGEQGQVEKMFGNYLNLIEDDMKFYGIANREFSRYISDDPGNEANIIFRKLLLKRLQENPSVLYNQMLSWLFVQQNDFDKAFAQERAVYKRGESDLQGLLNLAVMAKNAKAYEDAEEIIAYTIEESPSRTFNLQARHFLLNLELETVEKQHLKKVKEGFKTLLAEYGYGPETIDVQIDYANLLAFRLKKEQEAVVILKNTAETTSSNFELAKVKMALADILVIEEKFNEALIYYSQIQNLVKNDEISQDARFKVAKTSYYKGDFKWAKTQLDILKKSTSQLIANDAMELSLLIQDNSLEDTTQAALKAYARADLLAFQEKNGEAILALEDVIASYSGQKIEDEALYSQAKLFEKEKNFKEAESNYLQIIAAFGQEILADNANYFLAELYANQLNEPEKAKNYYEQIIFNFADSIYFTDARKKFRSLRGDTLE